MIIKLIMVWILASWDECPGSLCISHSLGIGVVVCVGCVDKNFNIVYNFKTIRDRNKVEMFPR